MFNYVVSLFEQNCHGKQVSPDFDQESKNGVPKNEQRRLGAQAVLDHIENPDVAQALRHDMS
ncbi:hypothetical protein GALMADRAFT_221183 [Galerina marginata CBS 339.88]|uniref:Uncharacterized protein n=1 Tax=Galerina marginata (strain CBS 339.88) TaxID=685588 RepID=A0A067TLQ8_GALM3|nr:hypothetical protein GALMADRAFT_221183 [Galerina marginata CBS 339.88]